MSKGIIIAIAAGVLVVGGGATYYLTREESAEPAASTEVATEAPQETNETSASFEPKNTFDQDFVATVSTETSQGSFEAEIEFDADAKAWRYSGEANGQTMELVIANDSYYSKIDGQWIKLPAEGEAGAGFDKDAYELTDKELSDFQKLASYQGEAECPAGTCDLWVIDNYEGNDKISFYVDKETNTINQMISDTKSGKITITYNFEDVSIKVPKNVKTLPNFTP